MLCLYRGLLAMSLCGLLLAAPDPSGAAPIYSQSECIPTRVPTRPSNDRPIVEPAGLIRFTLPTAIRETPYLVQVWVPAGSAPIPGWPVLYALDGKAVFDVLAREFALDGLKTVIVGISHDSAGVLDLGARAYDYTPPSPGADRPVGLPREPLAHNPYPGGGAETFLTVLMNEIEPALTRHLLQQRVPVMIDTAQRGIYGHSYSGLFVLYAYLTRPQDFAHSFSASPSLWWNRRALMDNLHGLDWLAGMGGKLSITIGDVETGCCPERSTAADFYRSVAKYTGRRTSFEAIAGMDHGQMLRASLARALTQWTQPEQ